MRQNRHQRGVSTNDVIDCAGRYFLPSPTPAPFPSLLLPLCISHHWGKAWEWQEGGELEDKEDNRRGKLLIKNFPKHLRHIPALRQQVRLHVSWVQASLLRAQVQARTERGRETNIIGQVVVLFQLMHPQSKWCLPFFKSQDGCCIALQRYSNMLFAFKDVFL